MTHGGKRRGAGRPVGSQGKKAIALSEFLNADENNPVLNLVSIGQQALKEKDFRLAADCFKALIPYYAPKVKIPEETEAERYRPITVVTNIPIPGQTWRKNAAGKEQDDEELYEGAGDDC